jgi:dihydroorotate dehydrogenase (fumarate)
MANLGVKYMGLDLKSPIIIGASNLSDNVDRLKKLEAAGAGAIVYKTLFEEQIELESLELDNDLEAYNERHPEMVRIFPELHHAGPKGHLHRLKKAKNAVGIPVIGSLNCTSTSTWADWAVRMQDTGIDGLELNFYSSPARFDITGADIISSQLEVLELVKAKVKIPISVKLSPFYGNPLEVISRMDKLGVNAFVLFNRMYQPDIDIDAEAMKQSYVFSRSDDSRLSLRYSGLLYKRIEAQISAATGVVTAEEAIKMILSGASTVQVVSAVYKNGPEYIKTMLAEMEMWMKSKGYDAIEGFRGNLSYVNLKDPFAYTRAQYIDILMRSSEWINPWFI